MKTLLLSLTLLVYGNAPVSNLRIDYGKTLERLEASRKTLATQYTDTIDQRLVARCSRLLLTTLTDSIFPAWYGTLWDFNGISDIPCQGKIACGYFISTTLKHAGFNLNRYKLAQQDAATITQAVCGRNHVKRFTSREELLAYLEKKPDGLYIVGLNYHVGFIAVISHDIFFIHSDYVSGEVLKEKAMESFALGAANIFVLGQLTDNTTLSGKWLKGEKFY